MKNKNIIWLIIIFALIGITGIIYPFRNKRTYVLNLPEVTKLENISLEQNAQEKVFSSSEEMENILVIINGEKRKTQEESIQDAPVNVENNIEVDFHFKEGGVSTLFIYQKNGKYYVEQPYNGIYQISQEEYNLVEEYIKW